MIGIQDSEFKKRHEFRELCGATRDTQQTALKQELATSYLVSDWETSVANPMVQIGQPKAYTTLEAEIQEINPAVSFHRNLKVLNRVWVAVGGVELFQTEALMPEWDIMTQTEEKAPLFFNPDKPMELDAPATETHKIVWNVRFRGWRSVLLALVQGGHLSAALVDLKFGDCRRPSWASGMGKQKVTKGVI